VLSVDYSDNSAPFSISLPKAVHNGTDPDAAKQECSSEGERAKTREGERIAGAIRI